MAAFIRSVGRQLICIEPRAILLAKENTVVDIKRHVRALKRRPVRVLYPEDKAGKAPKPTPAKPVVEHHRTSGGQKDTANASKTNLKTAVQKNLDPNFISKNSDRHAAAKVCDTSSDLLDGLRYEKAFAGDKRLARAVSIARSRKYREQQGKVLLEGRRLICDALRAGALPQTLFFSSVEQLRELPLDRLRRASLVKVTGGDIQTWSDLVTPQGVIAIFSQPDAKRLGFPKDQRDQAVPLHLICDNVRDPGNLGTILRCAAAAGCQSVLLTKGCVDVWEPKVLRAAMGAHFRLPIIPSLDWGNVAGNLPPAVTIHLADNCSTSDIHRGATGEVEPSKPLASRKAGDYGWVRSRSDSTHAAGAWESDSDEELEDEKPAVCLPVVGARVYHERWAVSHTALVIGGETHGLSVEALQLAEQTGGLRLFVPMVSGVDSLNSAMAASVLLFEGRRQLMESDGQGGARSDCS
ncbi:rRNA methyltransferase 3B, mitochondrial [Brienomyrus brachyistius]|uniref:rRNA methyltransferase 3B, mitochondrial n=1 Tax=Brienomyrus brachyistius TaxID=42636 RepID=UPI0020B38355|nr:rRNA methyltransferase 3B, mitochondrial [Brienomyrus brachyistius]